VPEKRAKRAPSVATPFGVVTRDMLEAFEQAGTPATARLVFLTLCAYVDHSSGLAFVSLRRLALACGLDERATRYAVRHLEGCGFLALEQSGGPAHGGGGVPNGWRLRFRLPGELDAWRGGGAWPCPTGGAPPCPTVGHHGAGVGAPPCPTVGHHGAPNQEIHSRASNPRARPGTLERAEPVGPGETYLEPEAARAMLRAARARLESPR